MTLFINKELQQKIRSKGIKYLIHFTDIDNLSSILENGIFSVSKLDENFTVYVKTDIERKDCMLDCISYSIEFPNYLYLDSLVKKKGKRFVVIRINIESIYNTEIIIHKSNPYLPRWGQAFEFEDMFFDEFRFPKLPSKYPTDPRAEIQSKKHLFPNYIDSIYYPTDFIEKETIISLKCQYPHYTFIEDDFYFNPRIDYLFWKDIRSKGIDIYEPRF